MWPKKENSFWIFDENLNVSFDNISFDPMRKQLNKFWPQPIASISSVLSSIPVKSEQKFHWWTVIEARSGKFIGHQLVLELKNEPGLVNLDDPEYLDWIGW